MGTQAQMCGLSPRVVLMVGMLNGICPKRACLDGTLAGNDKREKLLAEAHVAFDVARLKAREELVVSYFEECDVELAGLLDVRVSRIRLRDGERICKTEPSILLDGLAD